MTSEKAPLLSSTQSKSQSNNNYVLVIHGGAGTMLREGSTPEQRRRYKMALVDALQAGYKVLEQGGEAIDAAVAAVTSMENCPLFNSAKGAVFNVAGKNELETSIMTSRPPSTHPEVPATRRGMSLTLLTRAKNPSQLVRSLYLSPDTVEHPFLSGSTAEEMGEDQGAELVDPSYFFTEARWREHRRGLGLPEEPLPYHDKSIGDPLPLLDLMPTGTVGAVALDVCGALCAVTSTGGRTNKLVGRIGDTPHMGAGFWAEEWQIRGPVRRVWRKITHRSNSQGVAISGTGDGDYFIRQNAAVTIAHRMQYMNETVSQASSYVVRDLFQAGGLGGVICVDTDGNVALPLNCSGMYRGVIRTDGVARTAIFDDDELEELS